MAKDVEELETAPLHQLVCKTDKRLMMERFWDILWDIEDELTDEQVDDIKTKMAWIAEDFDCEEEND